jgi:hypothetical protein
MPQIIVTADRATDRGEGAVMLRERISSSDFESATFAARLVERLGWAVDDAHAAESSAPDDSPSATPVADDDARPAESPEPEPRTAGAPA